MEIRYRHGLNMTEVSDLFIELLYEIFLIHDSAKDANES